MTDNTTKPESSSAVLRSGEKRGIKGMDKDTFVRIGMLLMAGAGVVLTALTVQVITWLPSWARGIELQQNKNVAAIEAMQANKVDNSLTEDIKTMRSEFAAMRLEIVQRLTKVESKLEGR